MNKEIELLYKRFKKENEIKVVDVIRSEHDYNNVIINLINTVLADADKYVLNEIIEVRVQEAIDNSQYVVSEHTLHEIYIYNPFSESEIELLMSDYETINYAITEYVYLSLEKSLLENKYIQELEEALGDVYI